MQICACKKNVVKHLGMKKLEEYDDFYVQSNTLLLIDIFENLKIRALKYTYLILQIFFQL